MAARFRAAPYHRRHHSWPPLRLLPSHLTHHTAHPARPASTIDDDPFPFFLSAPDETDDQVMADADADDDDGEDYVSDWMNANIDDSSSRRTRSVSPFGRRRRASASSSTSSIPSDAIDTYAFAAAQLPRPASPGAAMALFRSWLDRMEKMYYHAKPDGGRLAAGPAVPGAPLSPPATPRAAADVSPALFPVPLPVAPSPPLRGRKRARRTSQSVGNRAIRSHTGRARVWREPAEDMYPLSEEEEYEEIGSPLSL